MKQFLTDQRGLSHFLLPLLIVIGVAIAGTYMIVSSNANSRSATFLDVSSPQCGRKDLGKHQYGIVGLNGTELAFARNPCLASLLKRFKTFDYYLGVNYPSKHCSSRVTPYNCGVKAAKYDLRVANNYVKKYGHPGAYWIDVETGPGIPWDTPKNNTAFIRGMYDHLRSQGKQVGFYTLSTHWAEITGNATFPGSPAIWYAAGEKSQARSYCGRSLGGGQVQIVQYINKERNLDYNITC